MLKNVKGKMANWVLRAFLEVINHISTKRGCGKTANHTPSDNENANQKFILAPTSNPIFLSLKIYTGPAVML